MNTPEVITAIAAPCVLGFTALMLLAQAREWIGVSMSLSVKFIPAAKRQPRTAVDVKVIPGVAEPAAPSIATVRRTGT